MLSQHTTDFHNALQN